MVLTAKTWFIKGKIDELDHNGFENFLSGKVLFKRMKRQDGDLEEVFEIEYLANDLYLE